MNVENGRTHADTQATIGHHLNRSKIVVTCPFCQRTVKLNLIIRSATHDLGCVDCFGKTDAQTINPKEAEALAEYLARPRTTGKLWERMSVAP